MKDRVSTKILNNGATRYGVYDETGALLRYEYIKLEDEPSTEGDFFNKANMLPDHIPALLGLKMGNPQVKDALNVLANVGNLHVWERVRILSAPTYKPEESSTNTSITLEPGDILYYSSGVDVVGLEESDISLAEPVSSFSYNGSNFPSVVGKYIRKNSSDLVCYYPTSDQNISGTTLYLRGCKKISATIDTPAGTTTDYLTSTDPNAYPKQSAEGGQDAYYTLGDVVTGSFMIGSTASGYITTWRYGTSVSISDDGTLSLSGTTGTVDGTSSLVSDYSVLNGKFVYVNSNYSNIALNDGKIYFIPSDANIKTDGSMFANMMLDKYQPVTGHAAIPANTTITYLGQLGGGARIEVGSYVGTGTYGRSNPNSLTFGFEPKFVILTYSEPGQNGQYNQIMMRGMTNSTVIVGSSSSSYTLFITWGEKSISWYHTSSAVSQINKSGYTNYYIALG